MDEYKYISDKFGVSVADGHNSTPLSVYKTIVGYSGEAPVGEPSPELREEYNGLERICKSEAAVVYYTKYQFDDSVKLEITMPSGIEFVNIKPESAGGKVRFADGKLTAETDETLYFVIQPNGALYGTLSVFLDKSRERVPNKKNVLRFTEGVYTYENCEYIRRDEHGNSVIDCIGDDTLVYVGKDAVVNASIELRGVKNVEIAGMGIISTVDRCIGGDENFVKDKYWGLFRYYAKPNILVRSGCENIVIRGVVLDCEFRGVVIRNSKAIRIENVKIFASPENADGINCYNTSELYVDGCFINSKDDCFCMYNSCDSIPTLFDEGFEVKEAVCRDVEFKNCILMTVCRPFVFGGHATGATEPRCLIENLHIHDCEIIETPVHLHGYDEKFSYYWTAVMRVLAQSEQIVRNITFENINVNVTKGYNGKLFHLHVRDGNEASYTESRGYAIENIMFKNIRFAGDTSTLYPSIIKCRVPEGADDHPHVSGVVFDNVTVGERAVFLADFRIEGDVSALKLI